MKTQFILFSIFETYEIYEYRIGFLHHCISLTLSFVLSILAGVMVDPEPVPKSLRVRWKGLIQSILHTRPVWPAYETLNSGSFAVQPIAINKVSRTFQTVHRHDKILMLNFLIFSCLFQFPKSVFFSFSGVLKFKSFYYVKWSHEEMHEVLKGPMESKGRCWGK